MSDIVYFTWQELDGKQLKIEIIDGYVYGVDEKGKRYILDYIGKLRWFYYPTH